MSAQSSSSLSRAGIVAIAVAAASIVIVGLALLLWFIRRQRERRHRDTAQQVQYSTVTVVHSEKDGAAVGPPAGTAVQELPQNDARAVSVAHLF